MDQRKLTSPLNGTKGGRPRGTRYERMMEQLQLYRDACAGARDPNMKRLWATRAAQIEEQIGELPVEFAGEAVYG